MFLKLLPSVLRSKDINVLHSRVKWFHSARTVFCITKMSGEDKDTLLPIRPLFKKIIDIKDNNH
jgi:hypothetical protein